MISNAGASPEFSLVGEGTPSPIEGVVFNPEALSEVLTAPQRVKEECEIEWVRTLEIKQNDFTLELEQQVIRYNSLNRKHNLMIIEKDTEIVELQKIVKKQAPAYKWMWLVGGVAIGGATYYGIQQAVK
tara:strand:+ start:726 stop:1112 length:387 start_codon:yes stop_codon:yes gene_type:complete